ncbi:MAG: undecaprenyldiphospho-muramoylpentapeptide beta-N-acetylglucosaminyltransferase [Proteobacteria bacterium]|nr:undecaprenyldiphospho-muramoylpentapeptide beta-N-acetylglucosaminyltransferase [Pseudomonadota bacterium]
MVIVIAAGGTGGHIIPALALADNLKTRGDIKVIFLGIGRELENKLIAGAGYQLYQISFSPVLGKGMLGLLKMLYLFPLALLKTLKVYSQEQPDLVIGFGGYPSFIPIIASFLSLRPTLLHEQNVKSGLANRFLSLFCKRIYAVHNAYGFWSAKLFKNKRPIYIGNPVRKVFYEIPSLKFPLEEQFTILVIGGSQGAIKINDAIAANVELLKEKNIKLIHQTGNSDFERISELYNHANYHNVEVFKFIDNPAYYFSKSHLIVSRAGAMSTAEITAARRPAIFIPLRIASSHQQENIDYLLNKNAALMLEQNEELASKIGNLFKDLFSNPSRLEQISNALNEISSIRRIPAADILAEDIVSIVRKTRS